VKANTKYYQDLKNFCLKEGTDLFGIADISKIKSEFSLPKEITKSLDKAVCIGVRLSAGVFGDIVDKPTKLYFHHYRTANVFLDQLSFKISNWIQRKDASALPIPASQIVDWQKQNAHLSHKMLGVQAGLGWVGRNNLLVNSDLGSKFRLATVLTNLAIKTDKPVKKDCGKCRACIEVCPVGAIQDKKEDFKHILCFEKLKEFQKANIVGQYICGICVKACVSKKSQK